MWIQQKNSTRCCQGILYIILGLQRYYARHDASSRQGHKQSQADLPEEQKQDTPKITRSLPEGTQKKKQQSKQNYNAQSAA